MKYSIRRSGRYKCNIKKIKKGINKAAGKIIG
jgi:hypothetical protein